MGFVVVVCFLTNLHLANPFGKQFHRKGKVGFLKSVCIYKIGKNKQALRIHCLSAIVLSVSCHPFSFSDYVP